MRRTTAALVLAAAAVFVLSLLRQPAESAPAGPVPVQRWEYARLWPGRGDGTWQWRGPEGFFEGQHRDIVAKLGGTPQNDVVTFDMIRQAGRLGWELVEVHDYRGENLDYWFKRPAQPSQLGH
jgi:hypothetical protein